MAPGPIMNFPERPLAPVPMPMPRPKPWRGVPKVAAAGDGARTTTAANPRINKGFPIRSAPIVHRLRYTPAMDESKQVFIGTDCGATMSKVGGVWADGTTISTKLQQQPTNSQLGREAVVAGWIEAVSKYLAANGISWEQVSSVGLAIPGPYLRYG